MEKLTAIIPTYNEAHNIVDAIQSIDFADEILIVDSFSTDNTLELAKPLATKIIQGMRIQHLKKTGLYRKRSTSGFYF